MRVQSRGRASNGDGRGWCRQRRRERRVVAQVQQGDAGKAPVKTGREWRMKEPHRARKGETRKVDAALFTKELRPLSRSCQSRAIGEHFSSFHQIINGWRSALIRADPLICFEKRALLGPSTGYSQTIQHFSGGLAPDR